jgi:polar amino acid transport system ATP-binding protein
MLIEVAKQGRSMLIVTHELDFAKAAADRIALMDGGVIIEEGEPGEILSNPKSERARKFLVEIEVGIKNLSASARSASA